MMTISELRARVAAVEARIASSLIVSGGASLATVRQAVAEELAVIADIAVEHVREADDLRTRHGLDTLGRMELALALEERLQLQPALDPGTWKTVGDVVQAACTAARRG